MESLLTTELKEIRLKGLYRKLKTLSPGQGAHAVWRGRDLLLFCGNDYLGLSRHPRVIQAAQETLEKYGIGAGAARLISGTSDLHSQLEEELARFKSKERALLFGSGYLTNLGVLSAVAGKEDLIVMDKLCHASLIDGARLSGAIIRVFPHRDYSKCKEILEKSPEFRRKILVSDTIFSMEGDQADLEELIQIKNKYKCLLVVDDAHGVGVFGPTGRGLTEGKEKEIDVIVGTLSKAFGVFGGFAAASRTLVEYFINFSRSFIFATAPPPLVAAAGLEALHLIQEDPSLRQKLWRNIEQVKKFLKPRNFSFEKASPIFPIVLGDEKKAVEVSETLLEHGILIPPIRYPSVPRGKARLRLTLSVSHTEEDLEQLFEVLHKVL